MKISPNGQIAFHSIRLREDGNGTDLVQYDFDGSIESIREFYTDYRPFKEEIMKRYKHSC